MQIWSTTTAFLPFLKKKPNRNENKKALLGPIKLEYFNKNRKWVGKVKAIGCSNFLFNHKIMRSNVLLYPQTFPSQFLTAAVLT